MFSQACVSHSVHRGGGREDPPWTENPPDRDPPRQRPSWTETPHPFPTLAQTETPWTETPLDRDPPQTETPHGQRPIWIETPLYDKERPVRILLECILVYIVIYELKHTILNIPSSPQKIPVY